MSLDARLSDLLNRTKVGYVNILICMQYNPAISSSIHLALILCIFDITFMNSTHMFKETAKESTEVHHRTGLEATQRKEVRSL